MEMFQGIASRNNQSPRPRVLRLCQRHVNYAGYLVPFREWPLGRALRTVVHSKVDTSLVAVMLLHVITCPIC